MAFPFENLQAYQLSLDWVESVEHMCKAAKTELTHSFTDQFQRSVFECVPLLEILKRKNLISTTDYDESRERLNHLGRMLTNLVKAHESAKQ